MQDAPGALRSAFDLPGPLLLVQGLLMSQAPALLTELLAMVEKLRGLSLKPLLDSLTGTQGAIAGLDIEQVKASVTTFRASATDLVEKLDKTVLGVRAAQGAGSPLSAAKGLFGR